MLAALNPQTALERKLANSIAWDTWRLDHLRAVEDNLYTLGREEASDDDPIDIAIADTHTYRSEAPRLELMSLYESRMTRNLHRNVTLLRELQAERKRNYERDKKEEVQVARPCEFNYMPIKASTVPSKNGFLFSDEEIATAAVRERYASAATYFLKSGKPHHLFGGLVMGAGDTILEKLLDKRPLSTEERREIESVSREARAVHRLTHPEKYGIRLVS